MDREILAALPDDVIVPDGTYSTCQPTKLNGGTSALRRVGDRMYFVPYANSGRSSLIEEYTIHNCADDIRNGHRWYCDANGNRIDPPWSWKLVAVPKATIPPHVAADISPEVLARVQAALKQYPLPEPFSDEYEVVDYRVPKTIEEYAYSWSSPRDVYTTVDNYCGCGYDTGPRYIVRRKSDAPKPDEVAPSTPKPVEVDNPFAEAVETERGWRLRIYKRSGSFGVLAYGVEAQLKAFANFINDTAAEREQAVSEKWRKVAQQLCKQLQSWKDDVRLGVDDCAAIAAYDALVKADAAAPRPD